jgi:hypothetical protein
VRSFPSGGLVPDAVHFVDDRASLMVGLSILATPATTSFAFKVGLDLPLFSADPGDEHSACILRQRPDVGLEGTEEGYM